MTQIESKIVEEYETSALGFPIVIKNLQMIKKFGDWYPNINWNILQSSAAIALITKPAKLTGGEIKFIRTLLRKSLRDFAEVIGVTGPAVKKWEDFKDNPTNMNDPTERFLRSYILNNLFNSHDKKTLLDFRKKMNQIIDLRLSDKPEVIQINASDLAA